MKAIIFGMQSILLGDNNIVVSGGMESMSKVPHYQYLRKGVGYGSV
jgi:acetyl-CoA C-acetyltransferase